MSKIPNLLRKSDWYRYALLAHTRAVYEAEPKWAHMLTPHSFPKEEGGLAGIRNDLVGVSTFGLSQKLWLKIWIFLLKTRA